MVQSGGAIKYISDAGAWGDDRASQKGKKHKNASIKLYENEIKEISEISQRSEIGKVLSATFALN